MSYKGVNIGGVLCVLYMSNSRDSSNNYDNSITMIQNISSICHCIVIRPAVSKPNLMITFNSSSVLKHEKIASRNIEPQKIKDFFGICIAFAIVHFIEDGCSFIKHQNRKMTEVD